LPWQDVQMKVVGKAARDVSNVFLKLWNYAKQDIARQDTWKQWVMDRFIDAANIIFKPFRFWKKREQNPIFFRKMERCEVAKYPNLGQYVDLKKEETELLRPNLTSTTFVRILKSLAPWSAGVPLEHSILDTYIQLIRNSKYFIFIENQFFIGKATPDTEIRNHIVKELIERVTKAIENNQVFRLIILIPSHTEGSIRGEYTFNTVQIVMKYIFQSLRELKASITRQIQKKKNEDSSYDRDVDSFLQIIHLRNYGQKSEEYDYIVEEIYVHSKIMIVDDLVAIIGSANINDRSMLGSRDSEIACVVYDTFTVPSKIDGKPYSVARFAHNMRKRLWMSHFQLESEQEYEQNFEDIMSDTVWDFTRQIAKSNTKIYEELFDGIMSNNYTTWKSFIPFSVKKELQGKHEEQKRKLKQIKGQVCEYPLNFMMGTDWVQNKIADWITSTPMLIGGFV
jgi:phospholipase D1/2